MFKPIASLPNNNSKNRTCSTRPNDKGQTHAVVLFDIKLNFKIFHYFETQSFLVMKKNYNQNPSIFIFYLLIYP